MRHLECVRLLLGAGAKKWIRCRGGDVAFRAAERAGHKEVVALLLSPILWKTRARLRNLKAQSDLNGLEGIVVGFEPSADLQSKNGRCIVELDNKKKGKAGKVKVKPQNLGMTEDSPETFRAFSI